MTAQALVPAAIGAAMDALAAKDTTAFTVDCLAVLGLGVATAADRGAAAPAVVVVSFLDAAYRMIQLDHRTCGHARRTP